MKQLITIYAAFFLLFIAGCTKRSEPIYLSPEPTSTNPTNPGGGNDPGGDPNDPGGGGNDPGGGPTGDSIYLAEQCASALTTAQFLSNVNIVEAKYDAMNNRIVALSQDQNALVIIDPSAQSVSTITLNKVGLCMDISSDGSHGLVGHDGLITYVDITSKSIVKTITVAAEAYDVVLSDEEWAYVMPATGQWTELWCVDLNSEDQSVATGTFFREMTRGERHPTQSAIYVITNGVSPIDIDKYDISNDTADFLYDSPYHGDYPFGGELWFSETGERIFTRAGTILKASEAQQQDIIYAGTMIGDDNNGTYGSISDSKESDRTVGMHSYYDWNSHTRYAADTLYSVFDGTYYGHLGTYRLPFVKEGEECYNLLGNYGFFSSSGEEFYVLGEATSITNSNKQKWVVATITID